MDKEVELVSEGSVINGAYPPFFVFLKTDGVCRCLHLFKRPYILRNSHVYKWLLLAANRDINCCVNVACHDAFDQSECGQ